MIIAMLPNVFGAFYIVGFVHNATDNTDANGYTVMLWKTAVGKSDNVSDVIGPGGVYNDEGNYFVLDCEALSGGCSDGDNLSVEVIKSAGYAAGPQSFLRSGLGFMQVDNMTLTKDTPPSVVINEPTAAATVNGSIEVNATATNTSVFQVAAVIYKIGNSTGNYSGDGNLGYSLLSKISGTNDYNDTFDTTNFANGNYTLWVVANSTQGALNHTNISIEIDNGLIDLEILSSYINITDVNPIENETVVINATIVNNGPNTATNVDISFYQENYTLGNQIGETQTVTISSSSNVSVNVSWRAVVGKTRIFVIVDPPIATGGDIVESDETNNVAYTYVNVTSYHSFYGNVTGRLVLADLSSSSLIRWNVANASGSNIYVTDSDSSPSFYDLHALGRNTTDGESPDDFEDLDELINMTGLADSINATYTSAGSARATTTFSVFGKSIANVPYVNSSSNGNFITGILWDTDDDNDGHYDITDKEDVVFVTKVVSNRQGDHGYYDYEIKIPAYLRNYALTDAKTVSFYAEIR